ncbi:MAG TPA: MFS transporter [Pantanalinema sp.]
MVTNEQTVVIPATEPTGFINQVRSFGRGFWAANVMELIERWAYYGVRAVLSLYIVDAVANGGLEFTHVQKGSIYAAWAMVQSLLPLFTGGYADRYGYKGTVAFSILIKIAGYLLMATQHSYGGFFLGCMLLATGTAVFKPGVQGIIANANMGSKASVAWGIFYAMVNVGGFIGPWAAGYLRMMSWAHVFYANAILVSLNFLVLLMFKEPERPKVEGDRPSPVTEFFSILVSSVKNVFEPRLAAFLVLFSGYWLMFNQLFDILPNFIDDWVNTSGTLTWLGRTFHNPAMLQHGLNGGQIQPEWMINIDAGAIVFLMIPIAAMFSRMKAIHSIILGILISTAGIVLSGSTMVGAYCMLGIFVFAIGEMMASPKKLEYLASIAPKDKLGLYMGYANVPNAIGWGIGSSLGGHMYQTYADKTSLAKAYMADKLHMTPEAIAAIPKDKVMETLSAQLGQTPRQVTEMLFALHHPEQIWYVFGAIGLASMVGLIAYNAVVTRRPKPATV